MQQTTLKESANVQGVVRIQDLKFILAKYNVKILRVTPKPNNQERNVQMTCIVFKCKKEATHTHYVRRDEVLHVCDKHRAMKPFSLKPDKE